MLATTFLPVGYPHSVTADYAEFQVYDTIQAASSYVRGALCTAAILEAMGVGKAGASSTAAALEWVMRDGAGMLTSLVFGFLFAHRVGAAPKYFRLVADVVNDVALCLELLTPTLMSTMGENQYSLLIILCTASVLRSIVGAAAGAARSALTAHFCLQGNHADVAAKEATQETAVTLIGMVGSGMLLGYVGDDKRVAWIVFGVLTIVHVVANYKAVRALQVRRLNGTRADVILSLFPKSTSIVEANQQESFSPFSPLWWDASLFPPFFPASLFIRVIYEPGASPARCTELLRDPRTEILPIFPKRIISRSSSSRRRRRGSIPARNSTPPIHIFLDLLSRDGACILSLQTESRHHIATAFSLPTIARPSSLSSPSTSPSPQIAMRAYATSWLLCNQSQGRGQRHTRPTSTIPDQVHDIMQALESPQHDEENYAWDWSAASFPDLGWRIEIVE